MRSTSPIELKIVAWLACVACLCAASSVAVAQRARLDRDSPFFRELLAEPVPADPADLLVRAHLFNQGQIGPEGENLARWLDRTRLMELLGEPMPTPAPRTIGEAIAAERSSPETFEKLRARVLESQLTIERAAGGKADDFRYDKGPIAYVGNSVWQGGATNRRVWIRVKVTSRSSQAIDVFGISIPHPADMRHKMEFWRCALEGGGSLDPRTTRFAVCQDDLDIDKSPVAVHAIAADDFAIPIQVTRIETKGLRLMTSGDTLADKSDWGNAAERKAAEILAKVPCEQLNSCAQAAKAQAQEAQRKYTSSPEYFEKQRAERRAKGTIKVAWGLALLLALTVGFAAIPRLAEEPVEGWGGGAAAAGIVVAGSFGVWCVKAVLEEAPLAQGYGGYIFIIAGAAAELVVACLVLWLGVRLLDPERRTRMQLAAVGFGFGTFAIFWSMFIPP